MCPSILMINHPPTQPPDRLTFVLLSSILMYLLNIDPKELFFSLLKIFSFLPHSTPPGLGFFFLSFPPPFLLLPTPPLVVTVWYFVISQGCFSIFFKPKTVYFYHSPPGINWLELYLFRCINPYVFPNDEPAELIWAFFISEIFHFYPPPRPLQACVAGGVMADVLPFNEMFAESTYNDLVALVGYGRWFLWPWTGGGGV